MEISQDKDLEKALNDTNDALTNGSKNGREVARRILDVLSPILLQSPDPRIKALGIALRLAGAIVLGKKQRRLGKK